MNAGTLRQVLLITDGCSNQGEDPAAVAALAREEQVTVNVIGVIEQDAISSNGEKEIEAIAASGGGVSQIVYTKQLAQTVQMVTRQAMTQTLQGVVNKELQQILGEDTAWEDLSPERRGEVMEVVDELGEQADVEVLVLVDTSASMRTKLPRVEEALTDLSVSLQSRSGRHEIAVHIFPAKRKAAEPLLNWTSELNRLPATFQRMSSGGVTPTGPALNEALAAFRSRRSKRRYLGRGGGEVEERID
ncbi:Ca-activated chloride channel family protein [Salsuginibacillus halophilus]|uniref:Ca-activated chloride channel family protein n=1 Tax=Salsuginibacillus halophilus TaxID=517424 RepID=A0A2P8H7Q8_9BACI|nr:VWA domain-containing protein [Salsuginibacillus halophilus]PSL42267.1 Ca-activated chloride channel family protein [Salsuginibacillus halophilus]